MISKKLSKKSSSPLFAVVTVIVFGSLLAITLFMQFRNIRTVTDHVIHADIMQLQQVFSQIHKECYIIDFEHKRNYIDFLNVISFVGSEVGSMNLAFAKNWKGAYLKNNPTIQQKLYVVLKNKQGFFIVPDDGVVLDNGKVIGTDIKLGWESDMKSLMSNNNALLSNVGVLAAPIQVGSKPISAMLTQKNALMVID